jgi:D-sedoheptulose 7-phosphate isomerase
LNSFSEQGGPALFPFIFNYLEQLRATISNLPVDGVHQAIKLLHRARLGGHQVFIMGNGGSAATASHFVCDLAKNTAYPDLPGFRVIGLSDNMSIFSALGNDNGYENVFVDQLRNFVRKDDVVIGISTSGNSENVLRAIDLARETGAVTIGMTGFDGGKLAGMVDLEIRVPSHNIQHVEDIHLSLEHMICSALIKQAEDTVAQLVPPVTIERTDMPRSLAESLFEPAVPEQDSIPVAFPPAIQFDQLVGVASGSENLGYMLQIALCSTGASSGTLILLDQQGDVMAGATVRDGEVSSPPIEQLAEVSQHGLAGWVIRNQEPALVTNTGDDERWLSRPWDKESVKGRSAVSVPLKISDRVLGSITLVHPQDGEFTNEDLEHVTRMATSLTPSILAAAHLIDPQE